MTDYVDDAVMSKEVIARLRKIRKVEGLSQLTLASKSGISQNMIAYIETYRSVPTLKTLLKLCNALLINPAVLFIDSDDEWGEALDVMRRFSEKGVYQSTCVGK